MIPSFGAILILYLGWRLVRFLLREDKADTVRRRTYEPYDWMRY